jgi:hypothetical protein
MWMRKVVISVRERKRAAGDELHGGLIAKSPALEINFRKTKLFDGIANRIRTADFGAIEDRKRNCELYMSFSDI